MANKSTIQGTLNWAAAFILNRPPMGVAGTYQEPALTIANLLMSTILGPPFAWQWNRNFNGFSTVQGQTDYTISLPDFGWIEKITASQSGMTPPVIEVQLADSLAVDQVQGQTWKATVINDDNNGNITFRLLPAPDGLYTITLTYQKAPVFLTSLYGPVAGVITSITAANTNQQTVYNCTGGIANAVGLIGTYVYVQNATSSANNGLYYVLGATSTTLTLQNPNGVVQAGSGGIISPASTWTPIPDKYNQLLNRGMLAHLHAMYDSATYLEELQIFYRELVGVSEGLSDTAKAIYLIDKLEQLRTIAYYTNSTTAGPKRNRG